MSAGTDTIVLIHGLWMTPMAALRPSRASRFNVASDLYDAVGVGDRLVLGVPDRRARRPVAGQTWTPVPAAVRGIRTRPGPRRQRQGGMAGGLRSAALSAGDNGESR